MSSLLRIFFMSWFLFFLGVFFFMYLVAGLEGPESVRVAVFAAPFWAVILSPMFAVAFTLVYRVYKKGKQPPKKGEKPA